MQNFFLFFLYDDGEQLLDESKSDDSDEDGDLFVFLLMLPWLSLSFPSPLFRLPEREFLSLVFVAEELHFLSLRYPFFKNSIAGVNWIYLDVSEMRQRNRVWELVNIYEGWEKAVLIKVEILWHKIMRCLQYRCTEDEICCILFQIWHCKNFLRVHVIKLENVKHVSLRFLEKARPPNKLMV